MKNFFKNFLLEQDENIVSISPDDYLELIDDVGGIAERITKLKPYKGKGIVITGSLSVADRKNIGPLTGLVRVMGRLNISNTNIPNLNGISVDGYVNDYGSTMWKNKMQQQLNQKFSELDEKRREDDWNIENGDDESEKTEALYKYLNSYNEVDTVEDDEGNDVPEDKYYIYPSGRGNYGYGNQYEWLGGGGSFNPKTYDVYNEDEIDVAAKKAVEILIDDSGVDSFSEWVWEQAIDKDEWERWLADFYYDIVRDDPENYDIPLELSEQQKGLIEQLQKTINSLNERQRREDLTDEQYKGIEKKIEGLEDTIQEIKDDPQGDYDESLIENEIESRVDEWVDDIKGFIRHYGYDDKFILDFVDTDEVANIVINSDGYGSILSSYDGDYDTYNINGTEYYVMRVN